jgi:hypothetical protein
MEYQPVTAESTVVAGTGAGFENGQTTNRGNKLRGNFCGGFGIGVVFKMLGRWSRVATLIRVISREFYGAEKRLPRITEGVFCLLIPGSKKHDM